MSDPVASNLNTGAADGSGRIRIVTEPALPAVCAICRRSANGTIRFIDFNFDLEYYGAVVFCEDCIKECLTELDFVPKEQLEIAQGLAATATRALEVASNELNNHRTVIASLRSVGVISVDDGGESEQSPETTGESKSTDGERLEAESDSDGSDSVGGLKNVSIFAD